MGEGILNYSILYVEDDREIRQNYVTYLKRFYEHVYEASNAKEAYSIYKSKKPDILILDVNLPGQSGIELLREIRKQDHTIKAIMLTAMSDVETLISASELKLTKYLVKPISRDELKNVLNLAVEEINEYTTYNNRTIHIQEDWYWLKDKEELIYNGKEVILSRNERKLLSLLFINLNNVVCSDDIIYEIWYDYDLSKMGALKTLLKNLRKKLPQNCIKNVFGTGYKIEA